jgi:alpha-glucosidase
MGATLRPRGEIDTVVGEARARAGALFLLGLPGSAYLYQGEELGLPEVQDLADHARRDPIWARSHGTEHGRDGCRIPLPWTADAPHFGFTDGDSPPWLPQPEWFAKYAVHVQQADQASTLAFYRAAVRARRALFTDAPHNVSWLLSGRADVLAYQRGDVVAVTVFGGAAFALPDDWGTLALRSDLLQSRLLPPNCAAWLLGSAMAESRTKALSARWPSM